MASKGRTLTVYLAADAKNATREMDSFAGKIKGMVGPALLGAAAAAGAFATKLGVDAVQGAIKEQAEITKLNALLESNGFGAAAGDVDAFLSKQAQLTTFTDSDLRPAFEKLFIATGDVQQAQDLLVTSMDLAIGSGNSLEKAVSGVAKAADGNTKALGRMVPGLDTAKDKTATLDDVTGELATMFEGQATKAAGTWEGQLGNVADAFGELQDSFGKGFLEGLATAMGPAGGSTGINGMTQALIDMQPAFETVGREIGTLVGDLSKLIGWILKAKGAWEDFYNSLPIPEWIKKDISEFFSSNIFGLFQMLIDKINAASEAWGRFVGNLTRLPINIPGVTGFSAAPAGAAMSRSGGTSYNITVQAGVGNPVEIARVIENTLRARQTRLGTI